MLFFFSFATECASNVRVGSFPTPFFEGVCCVRFLRYCDICVFASLLDDYRSRYQTLGCNGNLFWGALASCVHCVVVGIVGDCFVFIDPGCFVSLTMGCVVVTEPFDLTSLLEGARSPFQIGYKLILATSVSRHGWAQS